MSARYDISIVIIGAGISGFTCATKLVESGFTDVKVVEAEDRIGGRIFTTSFADGLIDLGAQWCHGIDGNVVHQLAGSESFLETRMDFSKMTFTRSNGTEIDDNVCAQLMKVCDKILDDLKIEKRGNVDEILSQKFVEILAQDELKHIDKKTAQEVLDNFRKRESSYCGCEDLKKISIEGFTKFKDCEGPTWLNWKGKGYKTIFNFVLVINLNFSFRESFENIFIFSKSQSWKQSMLKKKFS